MSLKHAFYTHSSFQPLSGSLENSFLPDQMIERLHAGFSSKCVYQILPAFNKHACISDQTLATSVPLEQSKILTRDLLAEIHPHMAQIYDDAFARGRVKLRPVGNEPYNGQVLNGVLYQTYDETINDPITLSHEFGHYIGLKRGANLVCTSEWQAFFTQEAQYHRLMRERPFDDKTMTAVENHRLSEFSFGVRRFGKAYESVQQFRENKIEESETFLMNWRLMHYHSSAFSIATALYKVFEDAPSKHRLKLLDALYQTDQKTRPEHILEAFHLRDPGSLEQTIADVAGKMKKVLSSKAPLQVSHHSI